MTATTVIQGLAVTKPTQRCGKDFVPAAALAASRRARSGLGRMRTPIIPMRAGVKVRATRTAMATTKAAATPMRVRKGMPQTASPRRATTTVVPAKTTADPAVATARPAASAGVASSRSGWARSSVRYSRAREMMKSA